jgi:hypothetical protein
VLRFLAQLGLWFAFKSVEVQIRHGTNQKFFYGREYIRLFMRTKTNLNDSRAAELTTGILCVSFPEMMVLFKKDVRRRFHNHRPTTSILQGSATSRSRRQRSQHEAYIGSTRTEAFGGKNSQNPYIELESDVSYEYGVQITPSAARNNSEAMLDNRVYVDREVVVSSHHAR